MKKLIFVPALLISLNCYSQLITPDDSLRYEIRMMQWNFESYADQSGIGTGFFIAGLAFTGGSFLTKDNEGKTYLIAGGSLLSVVGLLVHLTASKHIRDASSVPIRYGSERRRY